MRTLTWLLVLVIPAVWVAPARPAERPVPEGTTVQLLLLRQKSVQQELKLSDAATKKVVEFTNKQHDAFLEARKLGKDEQEKKFNAMEEENQKFLAASLNAAQRKRLDQIAMQITGLTQLTRPDIAKALSLTDEQEQKVKDLQKESRKELEEIIHGKDREGRNEKLAKLRKDTRDKVMAFLKDEQKAKIREMVGEPFMGKIELEEPPADK